MPFWKTKLNFTNPMDSLLIIHLPFLRRDVTRDVFKRLYGPCAKINARRLQHCLDHFRFPAFWGPNYDWSPDQDHGNVAMIALQRMLLQYDNDTITMLPAWPSGWNVRFRVNGPGNTTREGVYQDGKMKK
jgi:hypothetical protein